MSMWTGLVESARKLFETETDVDAPDGDGAPHLPDAYSCGPDPGDAGFTAAVVGLGAKLAKADGLVTPDEIRTFARVFRPEPGEEIAIGRVFDIARQTVRGYESYARRLARRYADRPCLLEGVLDGLFQIALADGVVTADELAYLESVAETFGFTADDFRRIKASHMGAEADDPYLVLGVPHEASFDTVRAAYRKLMMANHPDAMVSRRSAPREFEAIANGKAAAIASAYARIRSERGMLVRSD